MKKPLLKLLVAAGLGSRRQIANAIRDHRISVNGSIVENFMQPVNPKTDVIKLNEEPVKINPAQKIIVLMLNKPAGILSTTKDDRGRKTVIDILPSKYRYMHLHPAGRLDKDTTGLLLLTNDGELTYQLTHPKFEHEKEYLVLTKDKLTEGEKKSLEKGILLEDGITYPAIVKEIKKSLLFNYSITIHEGRKHQVHRMFEQLGQRSLALKRIRIGNLRLGNLREGETRELNKEEVRQLLSNP